VAAIGVVMLMLNYTGPWLAGLWAHGPRGTFDDLGSITTRSMSAFFLRR
jgi:hypothetical protein